MTMAYIISHAYLERKNLPFISGRQKEISLRESMSTIKVFLNFSINEAKKYIRLGTIVKPQSLKSYDEIEIKHLLQTIESVLVEDLYQRDLANALCNKRQVLSYTEWFKLYIENIGFRGSLSRELPYIDE